jgi:hypothetical protein
MSAVIIFVVLEVLFALVAAGWLAAQYRRQQRAGRSAQRGGRWAS